MMAALLAILRAQAFITAASYPRSPSSNRGPPAQARRLRRPGARRHRRGPCWARPTRPNPGLLVEPSLRLLKPCRLVSGILVIFSPNRVLPVFSPNRVLLMESSRPLISPNHVGGASLTQLRVPCGHAPLRMAFKTGFLRPWRCTTTWLAPLTTSTWLRWHFVPRHVTA